MVRLTMPPVAPPTAEPRAAEDIVSIGLLATASITLVLCGCLAMLGRSGRELLAQTLRWEWNARGGGQVKLEDDRAAAGPAASMSEAAVEVSEAADVELPGIESSWEVPIPIMPIESLVAHGKAQAALSNANALVASLKT